MSEWFGYRVYGSPYSNSVCVRSRFSRFMVQPIGHKWLDVGFQWWTACFFFRCLDWMLSILSPMKFRLMILQKVKFILIMGLQGISLRCLSFAKEIGREWEKGRYTIKRKKQSTKQRLPIFWTTICDLKKEESPRSHLELIILVRSFRSNLFVYLVILLLFLSDAFEFDSQSNLHILSSSCVWQNLFAKMSIGSSIKG